MRRLSSGVLLWLFLTAGACTPGVETGHSHDSSQSESGTPEETLDQNRTHHSDKPAESATSIAGNPDGAIRLMRSGSDCQFIVEWQPGQIDERFNLSSTDIERAMKRVQALWGGAVEQFELTRATDQGIVIDFQYDNRQELIDNESSYQKHLREQEILIEQRQADYEEKRGRFERANRSFLQRAEEIQRRVDSLNEWVREVNDQGGFTDDQLVRFEAEREAIDQRQHSERAQQTELEALAREANQAMNHVNEAIDRRNEMIGHYNETFAGKRLFTSGHYQRSNGRDTITIYQFQGETGLQRVLAHEIGHALGLTHLNNPEAIMFEQVSGLSTPRGLRLTQEDRQAIGDRCHSLRP